MPTPDEVQALAIARGRASKRASAVTAVLCGALPAVLLAWWLPARPGMWLAGFLVGLVWANTFEYLYHRFVLHLPKTFLAQRHLMHHATTGTPTEAEHMNLGGSPAFVVPLFLVHGAVVVGADLLLGLGFAPAMLLAFTFYFVLYEEMHWRIHLNEWLPPGLRFARAHHFAHHDHPDTRFNVFLPLLDWIFGSEQRRAS